MNKAFLFISALLLAGLVLVGGGCGEDNARSFYKSYCELYVNSFQDNLVEYFESGIEGAKTIGGGYFETVEECVQEKIAQEESAVQSCQEYSRGDCSQEMDKMREVAKKVMTRQGCTNFWGGAYCGMYNPDKAADLGATPEEVAQAAQIYAKCMAEIDQLCGDLPQSVDW